MFDLSVENCGNITGVTVVAVKKSGSPIKIPPQKPIPNGVTTNVANLPEGHYEVVVEDGNKNPATFEVAIPMKEPLKIPLLPLEDKKAVPPNLINHAK